MTSVEPIRDLQKIAAVKKILKKQCSRNYLLFLLGINSGLRISDILKLKVKDVKDKEFIEIREQKTGKFKRFPIHNIKSSIDRYIDGLSLNANLFLNYKSKKAISRTHAYRIICEACKKAGIKNNVGTHTLRKTFGYHFYQSTKDIGLLQNILNHSNPQVTLRYIGISQDIIDYSLLNFYL